MSVLISDQINDEIGIPDQQTIAEVTVFRIFDRWGNLVYRKSARNFGPIMAMAADVTIAQVSEVVELGQLDPEHIITPGIFVQHVVPVKATPPVAQ